MTLEESYAFCRRVSRRAGSSFHAGFRLLPAQQRRAMEALYAFLRYTDDLADGPATQCPRREALAAWRSDLHAALADDSSAALLGKGTATAILPALCDAVRTFQIPREHLNAVIEGVEMDLDGQSYETFDQLRLYCERVASAVGLACIHIWGFRSQPRGEGREQSGKEPQREADRETRRQGDSAADRDSPVSLSPCLRLSPSRAFAAATSAGIALQLTNILRDLKDDAAAGRVYVPAEDFRACGYRPDDLRAGVADERFGRLMSLQITRAESFYREAAELLDWLEPPGRRLFGLMMDTYRTVLRTIASRPAAVFERHIRLGGAKRLQLLARWSLLPPRKASLQ